MNSVFMHPMVEMLVYTSLSGLAIPAGGLPGMASWVLPGRLDREVRHWVLALGGGILVGTVAFALVPEGLKSVGHGPAMGLLAAGGFFLLDRRAHPEGEVGRFANDGDAGGFHP